MYLSYTEPIATYVVGIDLSDLSTVSIDPATNDSPSLYGFSITSDANWTYLYAQCHRQFGWSPILLPAHDLSCSANVTVGRVPKGQVFAPPSYWNGTTWQPNPHRRCRSCPPTAVDQPQPDPFHRRRIRGGHQGGRLVRHDDLPRPRPGRAGPLDHLRPGACHAEVRTEHLQHLLRVVGSDDPVRWGVRGRSVPQPVGWADLERQPPDVLHRARPGRFALGTRCSRGRLLTCRPFP